MLEMNKYGLQFVNKFVIGDVRNIKEFFEDEWDYINQMVDREGWYMYQNSRGQVEIEYLGDKLEDEEGIRKAERDFLGDDCEVFEDFIDLEETCFVRI